MTQEVFKYSVKKLCHIYIMCCACAKPTSWGYGSGNSFRFCCFQAIDYCSHKECKGNIFPPLYATQGKVFSSKSLLNPVDVPYLRIQSFKKHSLYFVVR